jgi:hypothetical protein
MAMVASRGPFRNLMGHILFFWVDFSMETRLGGCLNPFTESLFGLPKRSFNPLQAEVFIGKALFANYAEEAAELLLNLP